MMRLWLHWILIKWCKSDAIINEGDSIATSFGIEFGKHSIIRILFSMKKLACDLLYFFIFDICVVIYIMKSRKKLLNYTILKKNWVEGFAPKPRKNFYLNFFPEYTTAWDTTKNQRGQQQKVTNKRFI